MLLLLWCRHLLPRCRPRYAAAFGGHPCASTASHITYTNCYIQAAQLAAELDLARSEGLEKPGERQAQTHKRNTAASAGSARMTSRLWHPGCMQAQHAPAAQMPARCQQGRCGRRAVWRPLGACHRRQQAGPSLQQQQLMQQHRQHLHSAKSWRHKLRCGG
jgi:hypothetical protein